MPSVHVGQSTDGGRLLRSDGWAGRTFPHRTAARVERVPGYVFTYHGTDNH